MPRGIKLKPQKERSPFIRRVVARTEGGDIKTLFGLHEYKGQVGLEIEVEGNMFPKDYDGYDDYGDPIPSDNIIPDRWRYVHDGSLRGEDNAEYIIARPTTFDEVPEAIDDLWTMFKNYGSVLDESNRTSVHVHLNAQDWHLNRVCAFFGLYFIVEDILTHWCGDHRVGNLFCLRAKDAPGIVSRLKQFFKSEHGWVLNDGLHYSGLNALALKKLGSIEIRTMRGVNDPETIKTWVAILERIYHISGEYPDPRDIVHGFSGQSRTSFLQTILGPYTNQIMEECGMDAMEIDHSLVEGIRIAQSLCYCRDWSKYDPVNCEPDVFGRPPAKQGDYPEPVEDPNQPVAQPAPTQPMDVLQSAAQAFMQEYQPQPDQGVSHADTWFINSEPTGPWSV